jgi:hypothetical protein
VGEADKWRWNRSGYDERVHAFPSERQPSERQPSNIKPAFVEAACSHSVPFGKVDSASDGPQCLACLLIVGNRLADQQPLSAFDL